MSNRQNYWDAINKTTWLYWGGVIIWMGVIFLFSHQPALPHLPAAFADLALKKMGHASAYAILMALWWGALKSIRPPTTRILALAFILTILYAISDEWHQTFIPNRNGQVADVLVDAIGVLFAFTLIWRRKKSKHERHERREKFERRERRE